MNLLPSYDWYREFHAQPTIFKRIDDSTGPLLRGLATVILIFSVLIANSTKNEFKKGSEHFVYSTMPWSMVMSFKALYPSPKYDSLYNSVLIATSHKVDELHAEMQKQNFVNNYIDNPASLMLGFLSSIFLALSYFSEWHFRRKNAQQGAAANP